MLAVTQLSGFGSSRRRGSLKRGKGQAAIKLTPRATGTRHRRGSFTASIGIRATADGSGHSVLFGAGAVGIQFGLAGTGTVIPPAVEPSIDPDVWWSLNETSGVRFDSTANGYNLTPFGQTRYTAGVLNNCLKIIDNNSGLGETTGGLSRTGAFPSSAADWTWCGWVKSAGNVGEINRAFPLWLRNTDLDDLYLVMHSGEWEFVKVENGGTTETLTHTVASAVDTWYFWAVSYHHASKTVKLYIDGTVAHTWTFAAAITGANWSQLQAISYDDGPDDELNFDETARFPGVLTAGEILWLYNEGTGRDYFDVVPIVPDVWWTMDESSGTRYDSTPTHCDLIDHGDNVTSEAGVVGDAANVGDYSYYLEKLTPGVPIHNHDWTWFGWVKASDSVVPGVVVGNPLSIGAWGYDLMLVFATGTGWLFQKTTDGPVVETITYGTPPPIDAWQFWAISYDHSEKRVKLYLDAVLVAEEVWDNAIPVSSPDDYFQVSIGQNGGSSDTHLVDNMGRCPVVLGPAALAVLYGYGGGVDYGDL